MKGIPRAWSETDVAMLREIVVAGSGWGSIGHALGRSQMAVRRQAGKLRMKRQCPTS